LKARGLHWRGVLPLLLPEPESQARDKPYEQARDWRAIVAACLQHRELLSPRDLDFLLGASRFPYLSEKQQRWLDGIAEKLGVS
jgi:hypothetical protein